VTEAHWKADEIKNLKILMKEKIKFLKKLMNENVLNSVNDVKFVKNTQLCKIYTGCTVV